MNEPLLSVKDVSVAYASSGWPRRRFNAVDGVSIDVARGETLALVGESACGKSTLGRAILGLTPISDGSIELDGETISGLSEREMRPFRSRLQMIFQDSYSSLDPRFTALRSATEPLAALGKGKATASAGQELLQSVGLSSEYSHRRPRSLSGGQRQRVGIARALATGPELIVADEPVSALDVSVQAQVLNLLKEMQRSRALACLFISHDLRAVKFMADRIAVMYLGRIVETGDARDVVEDPKHPYTQSLVSVLRQDRIILKGDLPSPISPPSGCRFHTRCPLAMPECADIDPPLITIGPKRSAACILLTK